MSNENFYLLFFYYMSEIVLENQDVAEFFLFEHYYQKLSKPKKEKGKYFFEKNKLTVIEK